MREEDNSQAIAFIVVAAIIFAINLVGIFYGMHIDGRIEAKRESLAAMTSQENTDDINHMISVLEGDIIVCTMTLLGFVLKILLGGILAVFLFLPEEVYEYLKWDIYKYLRAEGRFQTAVKVVLVVMTLWNILSPILDFGDWVALKNEMEHVLDSMFNVLSHDSWFSIQ